jgi:glycine cleavage system regulatory protein
MRTALVLTVIADDRPGIVEQVADRILTTGANWEESRMARLAGKFAGLLRVSVPSDRADELVSSLAALRDDGLTIVVERTVHQEHPGTAGTPGTLAPHSPQFLLALVGNDRPGIIRDISRVLARSGVNIDELETGTSSAPMSGETLFRASARVRVPSSVSLDALRAELEALAGELMVDLALDDVPSADG